MFSLCRLESSKVQRNSSEMETIISTFFECFRYLVKVNLDNRELCIMLIDNNVSKFITCLRMTEPIFDIRFYV